ncbi:hypothetical protein AACH06_13115 [Ideonella sp. DXS29W]|uniref:Uncharacterized protein n=1 Tax=Ideonella lacteola TaxID=2984193 RepID=A0ABU9BPH3_9BURK
MSATDFGILAVVICNVLFLVLCTYMAWRMMTYMRDSQADLSAFANSLKAHAGRLNRTADNTLEVFADMKRELGKLIETARGAASSGSRGRPSDPYHQWAQRDPKALNRLIDQQGDMLDEVSRVDAKQFEEWRRVKQVELDRLLQQKQHVQQEFQRLRQAHDDAVHKLREHELRSRQYMKANAEASALRGEVAALKQQLQQAVYARATQPEPQPWDADADQIHQAQAPSPKVKELAAQLAEAEADRQRLRRQLEQIQDNLKRTLTEKEFIEDRFMQLDADRQEPAPSAPAAPAAPAAAPAEDSTMVVLPA